MAIVYSAFLIPPSHVKDHGIISLALTHKTFILMKLSSITVIMSKTNALECNQMSVETDERITKPIVFVLTLRTNHRKQLPVAFNESQLYCFLFTTIIRLIKAITQKQNIHNNLLRNEEWRAVDSTKHCEKRLPLK